MTPPLQTFLDHLEAAAAGAQKAEDEFRRSFAARIKALETERAFAFRRLNLLRVVAQAVAGAEHGDAAVGHAAGALRARLGWASDSEARSEVIARFAPVARAMFRELVPETSDGEHVDAQPASASEASTSVALAEFESWYVATHPVPFWVLFENVMPETPVVDF
jgi:hypothetical protein